MAVGAEVHPDRREPRRLSWSSRLAALLPGSVERDAAGTEPDPRFTFANERTFLAWSRTALALVVAGLGVVQLLPPFPGVPGRRHPPGRPADGARRGGGGGRVRRMGAQPACAAPGGAAAAVDLAVAPG